MNFAISKISNYTISLPICVQWKRNTSNESVSKLVGPQFYHVIEIIIVIVCVCGVIGNTLNLIVLTRRRLLMSVDILAKSAKYGLIALALSDMLFCLSVILHILMSMADMWVFRFVRPYGVGCINLFLMISTWLTVFMAVNRYFVVVYPLLARHKVSIRGTCWTILAVYVVSCFLTAPYFMHVRVRMCYNVVQEELSSEYVFNALGDRLSSGLRLYIIWIWPILADFIPIAILAYCNGSLIRAMRAAIILRKQTCQGQKVKDSSQTVTLTLIIIVVMLLVLASPAETLKYINPYKYGDVGRVLAAVANMLQTLNFASNFLTYCVVSQDFRQTVISTFACRLMRKTSSAGNYFVQTQRSGSVPFNKLHRNVPQSSVNGYFSPVNACSLPDDGL